MHCAVIVNHLPAVEVAGNATPINLYTALGVRVCAAAVDTLIMITSPATGVPIGAEIVRVAACAVRL